MNFMDMVRIKLVYRINHSGKHSRYDHYYVKGIIWAEIMQSMNYAKDEKGFRRLIGMNYIIITL